MAPEEVIELSDDEEPPAPVKKGVIDLTSETSDDEDGVVDIRKALNIANAAVAERVAVPPLNGTPAPPRTQTARQQTPIEDSSSHSETSPVKRKNRKKRSLNNPDVAFRIKTPLPPLKDPKRVPNAKRISNASNHIEEEEPIKRPSHHGTNGLRVFRRPPNGTKNSGEGSAPKTKAGAMKEANKSKTLPAEKAPKKKIATVKNVLNASLESLVPAAPRTDTTISNNSDYPDDNPQETNFPEYDMDPISPVRAPSPLPSPPPIRRNPDYRPYSPEAASKGAGPSSQAHWYVTLPPAGWHSQSAAAYPYLPPLRQTPLRPSKPDAVVPTTEAGPSTPLKPHKSRKRNRAVLSEDESNDWRPPSPKKRKHSTGDDDEDLSTNLDRILKSVVSNALDDQMETTLGETEEEVDQLIESAPEDDQEPVHLNQPVTPPSAHVEEDSERPGFFDDTDSQMKAFGSKPEDTPGDSNEIHSPDGNDADLEDSTAQNSKSAPLRVPAILTRDPEEEKLRHLLDSHSDVLAANYPNYVKACSRPGLSPTDAPWVILRPFLKRKLQLERIKLQKEPQNGSS